MCIRPYALQGACASSFISYSNRRLGSRGWIMLQFRASSPKNRIGKNSECRTRVGMPTDSNSKRTTRQTSISGSDLRGTAKYLFRQESLVLDPHEKNRLETKEDHEEDDVEEDDVEDDDEGSEEDQHSDGGPLPLDFYKVEAIRKQRIRSGVVQYLVKWLDWPETANTWEPYEHVKHCDEILADFEKSMKSKKRGRWKENPLQKRRTTLEASGSPEKEGGEKSTKTGTIPASEMRSMLEEKSHLNGSEPVGTSAESGMLKKSTLEPISGAFPGKIARTPDFSELYVPQILPLSIHLDIPSLDSTQEPAQITDILKARNYAIGSVNGKQEVTVFFNVKRSDGQETVVDNKFLRTNYPVLLMDFYERHLRFNSVQ